MPEIIKSSTGNSIANKSDTRPSTNADAVFDRMGYGSEESAVKVDGAAVAVGYDDPSVAWITRWAPYVQNHDPGQGQLPRMNHWPRGCFT